MKPPREFIRTLTRLTGRKPSEEEAQDAFRRCFEIARIVKVIKQRQQRSAAEITGQGDKETHHEIVQRVY